MGRVGYLILISLLLVGGLYVLWPEAAAPADPPLWRSATPTNYRVVAGGLTQEVDGKVVRLDGIEQPLDGNRHNSLWSFVGSLTINERLSTLVGEDRLGEYGLDASRELSSGGQRVRWGGSGTTYYVWDGSRLLPTNKEVVQRFDALTRRLDRVVLLDLPPIRQVTVDGLTLRLDDGGWRDGLRPERPAFNRRINQLYDLLERLKLDDLKRVQSPLAPPLHQVRLNQPDLSIPERYVRLWAEGDGGLVQVDRLPVQKLTALELEVWKSVIATFAGDYLFNFQAEFGLRPLGEIRVTDAGGQRFRLEKHGLNDVVAGRSQWDVVWPGGREAASENAAAAIALAFDEIAVREPKRRHESDQPPASARRITFVFKVDHRTLEVAIDGDRVWSATHVGTAIDLPDLLRRFLPDDMLDRALTLRGAERVVKVQRQWHRGPQAGRAEVVTVSAGSGSVDSTWRRTWPKDAGGGISALAVDRLARAFCSARTLTARLPTAADRAVLANPEFELDVRFAQVQVRLSNDHARLGDTTDQDLGYVFVPEGDRWRAVEKESGISHLVDAELIDLLQAPLTDDLVLPLVPSLVQRIEINGSGGRYALNQRGEDWQLHTLDATGRLIGDPQVADAVEVRRYLRALTSLRARRNDPTAGPFTMAELSGSVLCSFPGSGEGLVRVTLGLGQPRDGELPVMVDGTGVRGLAGGRQIIAADQLSALLPPSSRFVVVAPPAKP